MTTATIHRACTACDGSGEAACPPDREGCEGEQVGIDEDGSEIVRCCAAAHRGDCPACGTEGEVEIEVEGEVTPATPDVHYLANGDPGYPGDPAEAEVTGAWLLDADGVRGAAVTLTAAETEAADVALCEAWTPDDDGDPCDPFHD